MQQPAPSYDRSLFLFRRDLRLDDNRALLAALQHSQRVYPCFIFNPEQIQPHPFRSEPGLNFLLSSLTELADELRKLGATLNFFVGDPLEIVERLATSAQFSALYFNRDYTPFALRRDKRLQRMCTERGLAIHQYGDALLWEPEDVRKPDGTPYTVYTPFSKRALSSPMKTCCKLQQSNFASDALPEAQATIPASVLEAMSWSGQAIVGGRSAALSVLKDIAKFSAYADQRDLPAQSGTTRLAPHHKFGTISIRETFEAVRSQLGNEHTLIRELVWRDFFTHIGFHFPHVFKGAFHREYDQLNWDQDESKFERWCAGTTGFPIVDAGMRELNNTGFMHNRVRMIVASFLTKDLHLDWHWGERYFATKLADYDPAVNNGNWQWASSTGCDAQPYFRIFNPWLQQAKFDQQCEYIKHWIPELHPFSAGRIHALGDSDEQLCAAYPRPMLEHALEKVHTERMFQAVRNSKS